MSRRFPLPRVVVAFSVISAIALCTPNGAGAVWFGAPDMNQPVRAGFTCAGYPLYGLYPTGTTSCTWFTVGALGELNTLHGNIVPKGIGFITAIQIRTGPRTGPMRLTILKSLRHVATGAEATCCIGEDQSEVFTPAPNALQTIQLQRAIPVYNGPESATIESFDSIAISLLDTNSTIPAGYNESTTAYPNGAALYPLVSPGEERNGQPIVVSPYTGALNLPSGPLSTPHWQVMLQAEWEPTRGIAAAASSVRVRNGAALIPVNCLLGQNCTGTLRLQDVRPNGAIIAKRATTYGTAAFTIAPAKRASIKVRLSTAGQKLMKKYRSRQVYANATLSVRSMPLVVSMRITLRR